MNGRMANAGQSTTQSQVRERVHPQDIFQSRAGQSAFEHATALQRRNASVSYRLRLAACLCSVTFLANDAKMVVKALHLHQLASV